VVKKTFKSFKKFIKSSWEIFDNPTKPYLLGRDGKCLREGVIDNYFEMSIVLDQKKADKCFIVRALPYTQE